MTIRATTGCVKTWLLALAITVAGTAGCHDASKDLEGMVKTCTECKDKACADKVIDDFVAYVKANPNPRGNEQNAATQFTALMKCATDKGVDVNTLLTKTKSL
jgi:5-methylcytosine-specific restriction endonuclease McrA